MELQQTVVEGSRIVLDLLRHPQTRPLVSNILISTERPEWIQEATDLLLQGSDDRGKDGLRINDEDQNENKCWISTGSPEVLEACSDTVAPQGIVATVRFPSSVRMQSTRSLSSSHVERQQYQPSLVLVLDGVSDPGNVGTLLRSCVATGVVVGVVLLRDSCDIWNPKAIRSAMGTTFWIPHLLTECSSMEEARKWWDETIFGVESREGIVGATDADETNIYAATMMEEQEAGNADPQRKKLNMPHFEVDWIGKSEDEGLGKPSILIIGSEAHGLSPEVRQSVEQGTIQAVHIPMLHDGIESLNAGVCGSVILFEIQRQWTEAQTKVEP